MTCWTKDCKTSSFQFAKATGKILTKQERQWPRILPEVQLDKRPFVERSAVSMKEVMKNANDCNVFFNIEAVYRFEQYMINTFAEALEYANAFGSKSLNILLDTFHMKIEEDSF